MVAVSVRDVASDVAVASASAISRGLLRDLVRPAEGHLVEEAVPLRHLEGRQQGAQVLAQVRLGHVLHDAGHDILAHADLGRSADGSERHFGMRDQGVLDDLWQDVHGGGQDDHVLLPADHEEVSFRVHVAPCPRCMRASWSSRSCVRRATTRASTFQMAKRPTLSPRWTPFPRSSCASPVGAAPQLAEGDLRAAVDEHHLVAKLGHGRAPGGDVPPVRSHAPVEARHNGALQSSQAQRSQKIDAETLQTHANVDTLKLTERDTPQLELVDQCDGNREGHSTIRRQKKRNS